MGPLDRSAEGGESDRLSPMADPKFRLSNLFSPAYLAPRLRSIDSFQELGRRLDDFSVYLRWLASSPAQRPAPKTPPLPEGPEPAVAPADETLARLMSPRALARRGELAASFQKGTPFKHVVIDGFFRPEFCARLLAEFPPYDEARFRNERGHQAKAERPDLKALGPAYRELDALFGSPEFLAYVSAVTGIEGLLFDPEYYGAGTHENLHDMELDPHVDFTLRKGGELHRRVNLIFFLNPEWDDSWGGVLELHTDPWRPETDTVKPISPLMNRMVVFETSDKSWHGFKRIELPEEKRHLTRRSIALYLYKREERGFPAIPSGLTVFVDRPLPERIKPGRSLTAEDVRLIERLLRRRDYKLEYLYGVAIGQFNEWRRSLRH